MGGRSSKPSQTNNCKTTEATLKKTQTTLQQSRASIKALNAELATLKGRIGALESSSASEKVALASEVEACATAREEASSAAAQLQSEYDVQSKKLSKIQSDLTSLENSKMKTTKDLGSAKEKIVTLEQDLDTCADGTKKCREKAEKDLSACMKKACETHQHLRKSIFEAHLRNRDRKVGLRLTGAVDNMYCLPKPQKTAVQVTVRQVHVPCSGAPATIVLKRVPPCSVLEKSDKGVYGHNILEPLKIKFVCNSFFVFARAGKTGLFNVCNSPDALATETTAPGGTLVRPLLNGTTYLSPEEVTSILGDSNSHVKISLKTYKRKKKPPIHQMILHIASEAGVSEICLNPGSNSASTLHGVQFQTPNPFK